jgi:glutamyl-Q tRNA(Asp) synthetase
LRDLSVGETSNGHQRPAYRGRFAPSPTGPLHLGSLVTAVASRLVALSQRGEWLVRIDDIDPLRQPRGISDHILRTLVAHGLEWSGEILYQSTRHAAYEEALEALQQKGVIYGCRCSRRQIAARRPPDLPAGYYPGTCRHAALPATAPHAVRLLTAGAEITFEDRHYGKQHYPFDSRSGDFVVKRADGCYGYPLAAAIDDHYQGITEVVRGSDLLQETAAQIYLLRLLGFAPPTYYHLPLVINEQGQKLSKQNLAQPLDDHHPAVALWQSLNFLGQKPLPELIRAPIREIWHWAHHHWQPHLVPHHANTISLHP